MIEENKKHHLLKLAAIALITFIATFLAFYTVMEIMYNRITSPNLDIKKIEKMMQREQRFLNRYDEKLMDNPFEPKMRPMIVNLVKENNEYKVIIDLTSLEDDENAVSINVDKNILTVSGELDKKSRGSEKMINFTQSYYLDEKPEIEKIIKEKKGHKYIVTIPFED